MSNYKTRVARAEQYAGAIGRRVEQARKVAEGDEYEGSMDEALTAIKRMAEKLPSDTDLVGRPEKGDAPAAEGNATAEAIALLEEIADFDDSDDFDHDTLRRVNAVVSRL